MIWFRQMLEQIKQRGFCFLEKTFCHKVLDIIIIIVACLVSCNITRRNIFIYLWDTFPHYICGLENFKEIIYVSPNLIKNVIIFIWLYIYIF